MWLAYEMREGNPNNHLVKSWFYTVEPMLIIHPWTHPQTPTFIIDEGICVHVINIDYLQDYQKDLIPLTK